MRMADTTHISGVAAAGQHPSTRPALRCGVGDDTEAPIKHQMKMLTDEAQRLEKINEKLARDKERREKLTNNQMPAGLNRLKVGHVPAEYDEGTGKAYDFKIEFLANAIS